MQTTSNAIVNEMVLEAVKVIHTRIDEATGGCSDEMKVEFVKRPEVQEKIKSLFGAMVNEDNFSKIIDMLKEKQNEVKEGTILYASWGYDQTNVDFFKVVSRTPKTVTLVEIGSKMVKGDQGFTMTGEVVADPDVIKSEPFRRKLNEWKGAPTVKVDSSRFARLWDGKPKHETYYA